MNWDAVGALPELFGAAAVVISLAYLAAQIRQSGRVGGAAAFHGSIDGITEHFRFMYGPENAELLAKGLKGFVSLSPTARDWWSGAGQGYQPEVAAWIDRHVAVADTSLDYYGFGEGSQTRWRGRERTVGA